MLTGFLLPVAGSTLILIGRPKVPLATPVGGIFKDRSGAVLGCFAEYYGITDSFQAEISAAMSAINMAHNKGWHRLWLECNSTLVIQAFSLPDLVPWRLRTQWKNCLLTSSSMNLKVTHIYREGNHCADKLASFGVASRRFSWWDLIPDFINVDFFRNRFGLPNYRFR